MPFFSKTFLGPWGAAINSSKSTRDKLYGTKPVYKSPETAAAESLTANLANLPKAQELATKVNTYNQAELLAMLRKAIPGFDKKIELQSGLLESGLRGEVPKAVQDQLDLYATSKAVGGGFGASLGVPKGFGRYLKFRDFTNESYARTQASIDATSRWTQAMAQLTQPAMFNIGSAFISPQQQFDYNKLVSETKAAPNPGLRGEYDMQNAIMGITLGVYGGAGYQNAYRPASQPPGGGGPGGGGGGSPQYSTVSGRLAPSSPGFGSGGPYE